MRCVLVTASPDQLGELLSLAPLGGDRFEGPGGPGQVGTRIFGGLVVAQALVASGRTVGTDRRPNSLYATFLRPGQAAVPIGHEVDRVRDGRSFSSRTCRATQNGAVLLSLEAAFHTGESGLTHQLAMPTVPGPDALAAAESWFESAGPELDEWKRAFLGSHPVDIRFLTEPPPLAVRRGPQPPRLGVWLRCCESLGDDPLLHAAALTYASDLFLLSSALLPHGLALAGGAIAGTTLSHAVWFHEPFKADDWLLYEQTSPWTGSGRAMTQGRVFDQSGLLVATLAQEGLLRRRPGGLAA